MVRVRGQENMQRRVNRWTRWNEMERDGTRWNEMERNEMKGDETKRNEKREDLA